MYLKIIGRICGTMAVALTLQTSLAAQTDPLAILNKVQERYDAITDYKVKVRLKVDIQNFRMPNKTMQVFFKKPDKIKVKTSGFAIVPRFGLMPAPATFLNDSVRVEYVRSFRQNDVLYHVVAIYPGKPQKNSADIFLRINTERWTIDRVALEFEKEGRSEVNIVYQEIDGFWLPETTVITFNMKHAIPPVERPNIERPFGGMENFVDKDGEPVNGIVMILFSDFVINRGLKDSIFEDDSE